MSPCFNVQKALYFSHTPCAAAPLFTLCLKPETSLLRLFSWSALLGLVNCLEMSRPLAYHVQCVGALANRSLSPVIAVSVASDGDVELHLVVLVVRLRFPQVPLDAWPAQHHSTGGGVRREVLNIRVEISYQLKMCVHFIKGNWRGIGGLPEAVVEGFLCRHHPDVHGTLHPDTIVGQHLARRKQMWAFNDRLSPHHYRVKNLWRSKHIEEVTSSTSSILMEKFLHHS